MQSRILNYVDFKEVNNLLEGFNQVTGFATAILDIEGNVLSKSGWRQICTEFHRINPESLKNCKVSDTQIANQMEKDESFHSYKCLNGLIDLVFPIVIKGEHIANLFSGQFFDKEPDICFFKKQAKKYGFDESAYLRALKKVPIVAKDQVESGMKFLTNIIQMISELTLEKVEEVELNEIIKHNEKALLESNKKLELNMVDLLKSQHIAHLGTWRIDLKTNDIVWSDELYRMFGFDSTKPLPQLSEMKKLFKEDKWNQLLSSFELTRTKGVNYELEIETVNVNGTNGWIWLMGEAIRDSENNIVGLWGVAQNITERKNDEIKMYQYAVKDQLTGLYNRQYFEHKLEELNIEENLPISIVICDINGLKIINDSFGHEFGDKMLIKAVKCIKGSCRKNDIIAKIGGDEFAVVLTNTDYNETKHIIENIKLLASKEKVMNVELSIACGSATKIIMEQSIVEIMIYAEDCMYKDKIYESTSLRSKMIDIIMNALFEKSSRELQHSTRVAWFCEAIASEMNLDKGFAGKMRISGLVHDIGKIGVDEKILNKVGNLDENERRIMDGHPEAGWRILSSVNEFSELAGYVRDHHERLDGSGYPNRLKGEEVSLEARILAVADSYDAMTSERAYKIACSKEEAINELRRCSGTKFDKNIVEIFINKVLAY